jgi:hypothetical protein
MGAPMTIKEMSKLLQLSYLGNNYELLLEEAKRTNLSYEELLSDELLSP